MKKTLFLLFSTLVISLYADNRLIDICKDNTSSNYEVYSESLSIKEGDTLTVKTSRYTEFRPTLRGVGTLDIYSGGERTYFGQSNDKAYPDWSKFSGDVHIYPYKDVNPNCGFYGVVLNSGGKTFNPEDIEGSLEKTNSQLLNNRVYLHAGATLATNTGVRAARIGELNTEEGSRLHGPIKAKETNGGYLIVGATNTDATLAGDIVPPGNTTKVGLIKEGTGTYRITGNNNQITGSIRITQGRIMLSNDVVVAKEQKLSGPIGALGMTTPGMYVFEGATVGGTGHSASIIDLYGNLEPGDDGIGTLTLSDYCGEDNFVNIRLRPTSKLHFDIASADSYDHLEVSGSLDYWNIKQDFSTSGETPIIYIEPTDNNTIKVGDSFTIISANDMTSYTNDKWNFRVQYPKVYTWEVAVQKSDIGINVVAKVISLDYSGQGDNNVEDVNSGGTGGEEANDEPDDFDEKTDTTPLRTYAEMLGKQIGVAVPCWSYNINDYTLKQTKTIGAEFNLLVSENGTKYENTEPSKGVFDYNLSDKVTALGSHFNCEVRGHTFVWHKQNPSWLTDSNGTKNPNNYTREQLLDILKNHIENLVSHFKGKIVEWDAVNEMLSDDQTAIRSNPDAYDLRQSIWQTVIGEDYIDSTFVWAHRADPNLRLYLNDYGVEFTGVAKTEALYNLAKRLKNSGIPIHGVGLQCHLDAGEVDGNKLSQNIARYKNLGLECIITELDLGCDGTSQGFEKQAKDYAAVTRAMVENDNCTKMLVWGLLDSDSWRQSSPLLFNGNTNPKPAYYAVHRILRKAATNTAIENIKVDKECVVKVTYYYNLQGNRINNPQRGIIIEEQIFDDNSIVRRKLIVK